MHLMHDTGFGTRYGRNIGCIIFFSLTRPHTYAYAHWPHVPRAHPPVGLSWSCPIHLLCLRHLSFFTPVSFSLVSFFLSPLYNFSPSPPSSELYLCPHTPSSSATISFHSSSSFPLKNNNNNSNKPHHHLTHPSPPMTISHQRFRHGDIIESLAVRKDRITGEHYSRVIDIQETFP